MDGSHPLVIPAPGVPMVSSGSFVYQHIPVIVLIVNCHNGELPRKSLNEDGQDNICLRGILIGLSELERPILNAHGTLL